MQESKREGRRKEGKKNMRLGQDRFFYIINTTETIKKGGRPTRKPRKGMKKGEDAKRTSEGITYEGTCFEVFDQPLIHISINTKNYSVVPSTSKLF